MKLRLLALVMGASMFVAPAFADAAKMKAACMAAVSNDAYCTCQVDAMVGTMSPEEVEYVMAMLAAAEKGEGAGAAMDEYRKSKGIDEAKQKEIEAGLDTKMAAVDAKCPMPEQPAAPAAPAQ